MSDQKPAGIGIPGGVDQLFRQVTPLFLLLVVGAVVFEPWFPGGDWLRSNLGETIVLRGAVAMLGLYVLLLWGESLRLNAILGGVLKAFRDHGGGEGGSVKAGRNPKARLEAAKLLIAALSSDDAEVRETSRHNLGRLAGRDLGADPGPWRDWLAAEEGKST
ncbi:MAG: hypothetical protein KDE27_07310 [Planctomycetes bacterium]|nr:hypothetical protein [Planctomycetota bacterium]